MLFVALNEGKETRVSITPDIAKRIRALGHDVIVQAGAGEASGHLNSDYEKEGCGVEVDRKALLEKAQILFIVNPVDDVVILKEGSFLIGQLKPKQNAALMQSLAEKRITSFSLELLPRITRAQSMDILSSQSNLAGYRAVIEAAAALGRAFPLMMTAAGTVPAARVLILGAGVAGLQAIATARRLGAIVSAFDVRKSVRDQVESLGATFISVEQEESGEGQGGYAREMSDSYKEAQEGKLKEVLKSQDVVITTAQIPGQDAPRLISKEMLDLMKPGSVVVDMAVETGGNCEGSQRDAEVILSNGVKLIGALSLPSRISSNASQLYSRNLFNFVSPWLQDQSVSIDWDDEIVKATALTHDGKILKTF